MIFFTITKPQFRVSDWRTLRRIYLEQTHYVKALKDQTHEDDKPAAWFMEFADVYVRQPIHDGDAFQDVMLAALCHGRSAPGFLSERDSLSVQLKNRLTDLIGSDAKLSVTQYANLAENGALTYPAVIEIDWSGARVELTHEQFKFEIERIIKEPELTAAFEADVSSLLRDAFSASRTARLNFAASHTYVVAIYSSEEAPLHDVDAVHWNEDGLAKNLSESLHLKHFGVSQAYLGFGNSSFVADDVREIAALLPPILFVDGLYSINKFIGDNIISRTSSQAEDTDASAESLDEIENRVEENLRQSRAFERVNSERLRAEGDFKPWQLGIYLELFKFWRMPQTIQATKEAMQIRYEREASLLEFRLARTSRRQNGILLSLVSLQVLSIGFSLSQLFQGHESTKDFLEIQNWLEAMVLFSPVVFLAIGAAVVVYLFRQN